MTVKEKILYCLLGFFILVAIAFAFFMIICVATSDMPLGVIILLIVWMVADLIRYIVTLIRGGD